MDNETDVDPLAAYREIPGFNEKWERLVDERVAQRFEERVQERMKERLAELGPSPPRRPARADASRWSP